jgi:hypothetical protein
MGLHYTGGAIGKCQVMGISAELTSIQIKVIDQKRLVTLRTAAAPTLKAIILWDISVRMQLPGLERRAWLYLAHLHLLSVLLLFQTLKNEHFQQNRFNMIDYRSEETTETAQS